MNVVRTINMMKCKLSDFIEVLTEGPELYDLHGEVGTVTPAFLLTIDTCLC